MSLFDAARHRLRTLFRPGTADRERDEEFAFHQSLAESDHVHATGDASDARSVARRAFGNQTYFKEQLRWMGAMRWVDQFGQDLRFAARTFGRSPLFAIVAVLSIGLGIGANTAVFGVIDELMLKPLPVSHPEQLVQLWRDDGRGGRDPFFSVAEYEALRSSSGVDVGLVTDASALRAEIGGASYNRVSLRAVDGGLFPMLGVQAAAGRLLTPADDRDAVPVAVLGFAYAVRHFGSVHAAVGQQIRLQEHLFTIVGVLPREFRGLFVGAPMSIVVPRKTTAVLRNSWNPQDGIFLTLVTRFAPDGTDRRRTLERAFASCCANGELVTPGVGTFNPIQMTGQRLDFADIRRGIAMGTQNMRKVFGPVLYTLMAGVAIVLLMSCTNVGNLLLARAAVRSRELAVRMSLGASRGRVVRQLLAESALLATSGTAVGIGVAFWGTGVLAGRLPGVLRALEPYVAIRPNLTLLGFTVAIALICTITFGVLPAIRGTRLDPVVSLRSGPHGSTRSGRLDRGIIAFQMALALVLVASAGLLGATLRNLRSGIGDMQPDRLLVAEVESAGTSIPKGGERVVYDRILERLRTIPGVTSIAGTDVLPLIYMGFTSRMLDIPGFEALANDPAPIDDSPLGAGVIYTTPGFFATTGSGLVAGREFNDADVAGAQLVVIISETIARQFFAGRDPIGQRMGFKGGRRALQIVGVARDLKQTDLRAPDPHTVYLARAQRRNDEDRFIYAMRTAGNAADAVTAARAAIAAAAPEIVILSVQPMSELVAFSVGREQALRTVAVVFSIVAATLAAIGLYGVLALQVTSRTREIGIRMALGADRTSVVGLVLRQSLLVVIVGIVIGVPLALGASAGLRALLYGVQPFAPAPFLVGAVVLVGAGLIAALLPSRRAARVDPLVAIRTE